MLTTMPPIAMLWDSSHIWGFMALRSLWSLGFPIRLLKGREIAHGALFRKTEDGGRFCMLLVPGGPAAPKCEALGEDGREAVREYLKQGGRYLGFCGGAGLALSHSRGIGLCPWKRAEYPQRLLHLISGYTLAEPVAHELTPDWDGHNPSLPVWWPGRFSNCGGEVDVLARYKGPDKDFCIGDIALETVPIHVFKEWKSRYGLNLTADFLSGEEIIVRGEYGKGEYVLSYSHLETPASPDANSWLIHIIAKLTGLKAKTGVVPSWDIEAPISNMSRHVPPSLRAAAENTREVIALGMEQRLFFPRTSWLIGWKPGLPGSLCNNLLACVSVACSLEPTAAAKAYWHEAEPEFRELGSAFFMGAEGYLLAQRLSYSLSDFMPQALDKKSLAHERDRLFGHPMQGNGLLGRLVQLIEEYIYLCLKEA